MSTIGETIFDLSSDNHDEIWDDTELIRAYDRAHRQIQNRLRHHPKTKKELSTNTNEKNPQSPKPQQKVTTDQTTQSPAAAVPTPIPVHLITPPRNEEDALHSMLTAWYMAGYHAGQMAAQKWKRDK